MSTVELALALVGGFVAAVGLALVIIQLRAAGKGAFLIERNKELADAYEQVIAQLTYDRAEWDRRFAQQRDTINELHGEVTVLRADRAEIIANQIIDALDRSPVWKVEKELRRDRPT
jgi:hypothetical protein